MKRVTLDIACRQETALGDPVVVFVARIPQGRGEYLGLRRRRKQVRGKMA